MNALDDVLEVGASFAVVGVNALTCEVFFHGDVVDTAFTVSKVWQ